MASSLPTIPRYLFGIVEPILQAIGFAVTTILPTSFVSSQSNLPNPHDILRTEQILVYQLGNLFLLLAVIGLYVLNATTDARVARAYLSALWWGDLGHIGITTWCMGWERLRNVWGWNVVNWANIAIPSLLFIARSLYFYEVFGGSGNVKLAKRV